MVWKKEKRLLERATWSLERGQKQLDELRAPDTCDNSILT